MTTQGDGSDVIVAEVLKWLDGLAHEKTGQPFFAVIWFGNPHLPHDPLPADLQAAGGDKELGEIAGVDRAMGVLRKGLRERGLANNTMFWFNSDNGRPGDNKPLKSGKGSLYEGGIRVPGICEWPAHVKPGRTSVPVVTSDFYPTLLEAAGVPLPKDKPQPIDGISLMPLLAEKMPARPQAIGFMSENSTALSDNQYKLVVGPEGSQLYDMTKDPGEKTDLSGAKPEIVARMSQSLDDWRSSVRKSLEGGGDYRK